MYFQIIYLVRDNIHNAQRIPKIQQKKPNTLIKKYSKVLNRHFFKENVKMTNKICKTWLISLIREMQNKAQCWVGEEGMSRVLAVQREHLCPEPRTHVRQWHL